MSDDKMTINGVDNKCDDNCKRHVLSAGFLFYSHPPNSTNIYFLLGKDDYNNKWSDFGGRLNPEESEIDCAVREMIEETLCMVQFEDKSHQSCYYSNHHPNHHSIHHSLYSLQTYDEYFKSVKQMLMSKDYTYRIGIDITLKPNEKHIFTPKKGFDISKLSVCSTSSISTIHPCKNNQATRRLRVCYLKYIPWQPELPLMFSKTYAYLYNLKNLSSLDEKIEYYGSLPRELKTHPAIVIQRDDSKITNITVPDEWMEKNQLSWWSVRRIKNAIKNNGKYNRKQIIRTGFLSTLSIVIDFITRKMKNQSNNQYTTLSVDSNHLTTIYRETMSCKYKTHNPIFFQIKF